MFILKRELLSRYPSEVMQYLTIFSAYSGLTPGEGGGVAGVISLERAESR